MSQCACLLSFNPNQGGLLCRSIKWGGSKWHIAPMLSFHPQKLSKLTKTGLRWKLASLCTYMSFEIHPMFHKIFIRSSQSSPIWTEKIFSSFLSKNGEYSQYFDLHIQYLYQMKAQTIQLYLGWFSADLSSLVEMTYFLYTANFWNSQEQGSKIRDSTIDGHFSSKSTSKF